MIKLSSKQVDTIADAINTACECYLEKIEELNEEYDRIEFEAHYENRPHTHTEADRLSEITTIVDRLEELNGQALEALELLRVAEFGE